MYLQLRSKTIKNEQNDTFEIVNFHRSFIGFSQFGDISHTNTSIVYTYLLRYYKENFI